MTRGGAWVGRWSLLVAAAAAALRLALRCAAMRRWMGSV